MKLGLALSGGGIRGIAHAGALKALEENNIKIDVIGGTSSGSIIATLYSKDMQENLLIKIQNLFSQVLEISFQIKKFRLLDFILEKRLKEDLMKLPKEKEFEN